MKNLEKLIFIIFAVIILCTTHVCAADNGTQEPQLLLEGESNATPGETKTAIIKVTSPNVEIGVVSGKIQKNENITNMTITGMNNWTLTYNAGTGSFNIYKAEGSKSEEIISIEYTVANSEGTAEISLSDVKLTTIDYQSKSVSNIKKEITIASQEDDGGEENPPAEVKLTAIKIKTAPKKTTYVEGEKFDKTGMVVEAEYSDGTKKEVTNYTYNSEKELTVADKEITITYKEGNVTKTVGQGITVTAKSNNDEGENETTPPEENNPPAEVKLTAIKIKTAPKKTTYVEGEKFDKTGMVIEAEYSDGTKKEVTNYTYNPEKELKVADKKIIITYEEGSVTKTVEQKITVQKDQTLSDKNLPQTGLSTGIITMIVVVAIIIFVTYRKNLKYKDVK